MPYESTRSQNYWGTRTVGIFGKDLDLEALLCPKFQTLKHQDWYGRPAVCLSRKIVGNADVQPELIFGIRAAHQHSQKRYCNSQRLHHSYSTTEIPSAANGMAGAVVLPSLSSGATDSLNSFLSAVIIPENLSLTSIAAVKGPLWFVPPARTVATFPRKCGSDVLSVPTSGFSSAKIPNVVASAGS